MYVTKIGYGTRRDYDNSVIIMILGIKLGQNSNDTLIEIKFY